MTFCAGNRRFKIQQPLLAKARPNCKSPENQEAWPSDIWALGCILYELCALKVAGLKPRAFSMKPTAESWSQSAELEPRVSGALRGQEYPSPRAADNHRPGVGASKDVRQRDLETRNFTALMSQSAEVWGLRPEKVSSFFRKPTAHNSSRSLQCTW